jgi:hypothetical protein
MNFMKRKRLYIFIIILIAAVIFGIAAICNQCAIAPSAATVKAGAEDTALPFLFLSQKQPVVSAV